MAPGPSTVYMQPDPNNPVRVIGRYALYGRLATGGMATVHFGRLLGPVGFSRTVAIKRLHAQFAKDPEFAGMFLDEARLAARIQHPNVAATLDVVAMEDELFLVMDYIRGESFSRVIRGARRQGLTLPEGFIGSVTSGMLHGLHAAHEATDERGEALRIVHRDVSPQNILIGTDGIARVLDFGVAKAAARIQVTRDGQMKGKLGYMSPEQLSGAQVDRRADVFAAGVVLWEALTGSRLFVADSATEVLTRILQDTIPPPSSVDGRIRPEVDRLVLRALERNPDHRFSTARQFAIAVEETMAHMSSREVGEWVEAVAGESLSKKEETLAEIESISRVSQPAIPNSLAPSTLNAHAGTSPVPAADDSAAPRLSEQEAETRIYDAQRVRPLPIGAQDETQIYQGQAISAPTAIHPSQAVPPVQPRRRVLVWGGAGGALLALLLIWLTQPLPVGEDVAVPERKAAGNNAMLSPPSAAPAKPAPPALPTESLVDAPGASKTLVGVPRSVEDLPILGKKRRAYRPEPKRHGNSPPPADNPESSSRRQPNPCQVPTHVDKDGISRIKTECL